MSLPTFKIHALGTRLALLTFALTTIFCFKLWQPKRQIELHQKNLLSAVKNKNWSRVEGLLSAHYHDRLGYERKTALADLREIMRHFFSLTIRSQGDLLRLSSDHAQITCNLTLTGTGTAATEFITDRVNQLTDRWTFTWKKESAWPWDWKLVSAENPGLNVSEARGQF